MGSSPRRMQRRITRTRLGAMPGPACFGRRDRGFLPVWQGELVYGDLAHRNIARAACAADSRQRPRVVGAHSFVDHWGVGGASRRRGAAPSFWMASMSMARVQAADASRV